MLDHIVLSVSDYEKGKDFYKKVLAPLGYVLTMEISDAAGFSAEGKTDFWIRGGDKNTPKMHIAFTSINRTLVDAFYKAAIASGGRDNGLPGVRKEHHPCYYAAFVFDPDGHNIEAVCHGAE